jgi:hypothetical protein
VCAFGKERLEMRLLLLMLAILCSMAGAAVECAALQCGCWFGALLLTWEDG